MDRIHKMNILLTENVFLFLPIICKSICFGLEYHSFIKVGRNLIKKLEKMSVRINKGIFKFRFLPVVIKWLLALLYNLVGDIALYILSRIRMFLVYLKALVHVLVDYASEIKKLIVKRMFWGRGVSYKYFAQFSLVVIVVFILFIGSYNTPITQANNSDIYSAYVGVEERDLLVESGSIETLIPEKLFAFEMKEYTVKKGDSISSIAADNGISQDAIKWANDLTSVHIIKAGMVLKIPPGDGIMYIVRKGDSVGSIADEYNIPSQAVQDMNWLPRDLSLNVGQSLFLPDAKRPEKIIVHPHSIDVISPRPDLPPVDPNVGRFAGWPVASTSATYISQCSSWSHVAIDIADRNAPDIVAAATGTIIFAGWKPSYGYVIQIDHNNGYSTMYGHLNKIYVTSGQLVSKGQAIGQMGSTGNSTGTHVHFEVRKGLYYGDCVNPAPYMEYSGICG